MTTAWSPTDCLVLVDLETASAADINVGAWAYSLHPSTIVHCVCFGLASRDGRLRRYDWIPGDPFPHDVKIALLANRPVVAHNKGFERAIWLNILVPNYSVPTILDDQWLDTAAMASAANLPRALAAVGEALGCEVAKDTEGAKVMKIMAKAKPDGQGGWKYDRDPERFATLLEYCWQDVASTHDVLRRLPPMHPLESATWAADQEINERGVRLDVDLVDNCLTIMEQRKQQIIDEVSEATGGELLGVTSIPALKRWLTAQGVDMPTKKRPNGKTSVALDKHTIAMLFETRTDLPENVKTVLRARAETGKLTSLAKLKRVHDMVDHENRLRGAFLYAGAHTGRWSSQGIQLHNLPKNKMPEDVFESVRAVVGNGDLEMLSWVHEHPLNAMSQLLRSVLVSGPGKDMIAADYSSIEARVIAWLADQRDILELFQRNEDVYVYAAKRAGSTSRQLGKVLTLALGYGMGSVKFASTAEQWGVPLELEEADRLKKQWRETNTDIVAYWKTCEDAFRSAIREPGKVFPIGRHVTAQMRGGTLYLTLPSGRAICYHRPFLKWTKKKVPIVAEDGSIAELEIESEEIRYWRPKHRTMKRDATYGGKIAENITQAVARDILAEAMIRLRGTIYKVVAHVHDSLASEVPEGHGDVTEFENLIAEIPSWAEGLPIAAEGYRDKFFRG